VFERDKRKPYYDAYQQAVANNLPIIYLYSGKSLLAVRTELQNLYVTPLGGAFHNMESIWLKPNR
jgi:ABC-type transport system substrate-binding protein